jgi:hypothetical protein
MTDQGTALDLRSFDDLTDARQAAMTLSGSGILSAHERNHVLSVANHIDQAIAIKHKRGDADRELETFRERWPDWDFRLEGAEGIAQTKDRLCIFRSESLIALNEHVRQEEESSGCPWRPAPRSPHQTGRSSSSTAADPRCT